MTMMHQTFNAARVRGTAARIARLLGATSLASLAAALHAAAQTAPAPAVEEVLVTGSLIHGAPAVGVPVTAISAEDFRTSGSLTMGDLMRTVPSITVVNSALGNTPAPSQAARGADVTIHNLGEYRLLLMVDGM